MGAVPAYITLANWFPKDLRGRMGAIWNTSQNLGGGAVAPIVMLGMLWIGTEHWKVAAYMLPAGIAILVAILVLVLGKSSPVGEGLPPLNQMFKSELDPAMLHKANCKPPEDMSTWQIFTHYVLPNQIVWYTTFVDISIYVIRFGMISWMPLYLLYTKGFSKAQMGVAFLIFEWAAIPSTLLAGWVSDKWFKGYRMPPAIIATAMIFFCVFGYWKGTSVLVVTISAGLTGCLIYVPQLLANVQRIEIVPPFAVGSSVGLSGFMSYIVGSTIGTSLFGLMVDRFGWNGGIMVLFGGVTCCLIMCTLSHFGSKNQERKLIKEKEKALIAEKAIQCQGVL
jgi:OPA family phosphoglycerate-like MFS transporter